MWRTGEKQWLSNESSTGRYSGQKNTIWDSHCICIALVADMICMEGSGEGNEHYGKNK